MLVIEFTLLNKLAFFLLSIFFVPACMILFWELKNEGGTGLRRRNFFIIVSYYILVLPFAFKGERIIDGFTNVEELTIKIMNESKYEFDGSLCRDGSLSHSRGRGTCSWHGGVRRTIRKGECSKTIFQARKEAKERSWIDR